jgi:hypothetical protein
MSFSSKNVQFRRLWDKTLEFEKVIEALQRELLIRPDEHEAVFQRWLEQFPQLIDIYGSVTARPRFIYPEGKSPIGKAYVEPDFVVTYNDGTFRIIEIERPNKELVTMSGQPRSEVTQAAFQIAEFRRYIEDHSSLLQDKFPGIRASACRYTIIIGRRKIETEKFGSFDEVRAFLRSTFNVDEVVVYDDVLDRARTGLEGIRSVSMLARGA